MSLREREIPKQVAHDQEYRPETEVDRQRTRQAQLKKEIGELRLLLSRATNKLARIEDLALTS